MYPEDSSNAEDDGVEGVNLASSVDTSIENRQDSGHVTYENNQGMQADINTKNTKNLFHNFMQMYGMGKTRQLGGFLVLHCLCSSL